jgi:hypothetical protein
MPEPPEAIQKDTTRSTDAPTNPAVSQQSRTATRRHSVTPVAATRPHVRHGNKTETAARVDRRVADRYTAELNRAELESVAWGSSMPPRSW